MTEATAEMLFLGGAVGFLAGYLLGLWYQHAWLRNRGYIDKSYYEDWGGRP